MVNCSWSKNIEPEMRQNLVTQFKLSLELDHMN